LIADWYGLASLAVAIAFSQERSAFSRCVSVLAAVAVLDLKVFGSCRSGILLVWGEGDKFIVLWTDREHGLGSFRLVVSLRSRGMRVW
jgi:hypothetical protein